MKYVTTAPFVRRIFTFRVITSSLVLSFIYLSILLYAPNYRLLVSLLHNDYTFSAKGSLLISLFFGGLQTQSPLGLFLLLLTALLIGVNASLLLGNYQTVRKNGKAHLAVGGSMVLGFVSTSCAVMCGFSLLPLIGTTIGASFSVLDGIPFRLLTVFLLSISLFYTVNAAKDKRAWLVNSSNKEDKDNSRNR